MRSVRVSIGEKEISLSACFNLFLFWPRSVSSQLHTRHKIPTPSVYTFRVAQFCALLSKSGRPTDSPWTLTLTSTDLLRARPRLQHPSQPSLVLADRSSTPRGLGFQLSAH
ncbi:hypothetical protein QCA50_019808 [Cerrena zonata]|uniref:Uncharacterized protein n=1 Tax=Cerrena zonata TaxID=2478898 RepID=A0AAW0FGF9_9APHY